MDVNVIKKYKAYNGDNKMSEIKDNPEELKRMEENQNDGPVLMLNLLKFKLDGAAFFDLYSI